jgi:hypothetical protein
MKRRKNYLHTKFIKFLVESEKQKLREVETDEVEDADEVETDEVETDEVEDADEVIERLTQRLKNSYKEFDDIIHGRK